MEYWKWNKALVPYYFTNNKEKEIIIYVDNAILDKIGYDNNLGTHIDFYKTVIINSDKRFLIIDPYTRTKRTTEDNRKVLKNLFSFAHYLSDINIVWPKLPFFNYIVLAIVAYDGKNSYKSSWDTLIQRYLRGDNSNRKDLEILFDKLHNYDKRFINRKLTQQRYVGLIKFQVVLNYQETQELEDILYKYKIEVNEDIEVDYLRLINKVLPYTNAGSSLRSKIVKSLKENYYAVWIENKIRNFNPDNYFRYEKETISRKTTGQLTISFKDQKLFLFSDVRFDNEHVINDLKLPKTEIDNIEGYFISPICDINKPIKFQKYEINTNNLALKTISIKEINFLQKHSGYYIQTLAPIPHCETIVLVKNDNKVKLKWENWAKINTEGLESIPSEKTKDIFADDWCVFKTTNLLDQFYKQKDLENCEILERSGVRRIGGISPEGMKETYLINALPYYEINIFNLDIDKFKVKIKRGEHIDNSFNWELYSNNLIIKLNDLNLQITNAELIEVEIKYKNELQIIDFFTIIGAYTKEMSHLFKYDKWGDSILETSVCSHYIGNKVNTSEKVESRSKHKIEHSIPNLRIEKFQIVNILSSINYLGNGYLKEKQIENAIRYAGLISNYDLSLKIKEIIRNLVYLGYLSSNYIENGIVKYQINPPTFVKIARSFQVGGNQVYMLMGGFTQLFLQKLKLHCETNDIMIQFRPVCYYMNESRLSNLSIYGFLPDTIFIDSSINLERFKIESGLYFEVECTGMTDSLLRFLPSISEFENTFLNDSNKELHFDLDLEDTSRILFPRIRESKNPLYTNIKQKWIEQKKGEFFGRQLIAIPPKKFQVSWMEFYIKFKQKECVMLMEYPKNNNLHNHIYLPITLNLPLLLRKAFIQFNAGLGTFYNVFLLNNDIDNNALYTRLSKYNVSNNRDRRNETARILTGKSDYLTNNQIKLFYKGYYDWSIILMCSDEDFVTNGWRRFLMIYKSDELKAIVSKTRIFVSIDTKNIQNQKLINFKIDNVEFFNFKEINIINSINKTLSMIIIGIEGEITKKPTLDEDFKLYNNYNKQEITIIN